MILDNNLIAYEYYKNQYTPKEVYKSGEKDETKLIDKYSKRNPLAVLALEDDIINPQGYGLKKGFYNVIPDEFKDFLLIYQGGNLKAKIPVVKIERFSSINTEQKKIKKMSKKQYKKYQEKEYKKYSKGENITEYEYKEVSIEYIAELQAWVIKYCENNLEISGMIKF